MASTRDPRPSGAYAQLDDLVRLRHKAVGFSFLPRQPVHSVLAGRHGSRLRGRGFDFEEIRHYVAGDDPRSFDWRVTARLREPHVRVFTEERDRPVLLVVDQRGPMFFGSRQRMKSVTAAEAAALAGWRVLEQGDRVGALVFDDRELVEVRPQRSRRNQMRILHEIEKGVGASALNRRAVGALIGCIFAMDQPKRRSAGYETFIMDPYPLIFVENLRNSF